MQTPKDFINYSKLLDWVYSKTVPANCLVFLTHFFSAPLVDAG
jgi:hypothetical protein